MHFYNSEHEIIENSNQLIIKGVLRLSNQEMEQILKFRLYKFVQNSIAEPIIDLRELYFLNSYGINILLCFITNCGRAEHKVSIQMSLESNWQKKLLQIIQNTSENVTILWS